MCKGIREKNCGGRSNSTCVQPLTEGQSGPWDSVAVGSIQSSQGQKSQSVKQDSGIPQMFPTIVVLTFQIILTKSNHNTISCT